MGFNCGFMSIVSEKEILRKKVYDNLFNLGYSNRSNGDYGKIPDFKGSILAAENLASTSIWKSAKTVFVSPDSAQTPVRYLALKQGKNLIMASPNLEHGYLFLKSDDFLDLDDKQVKEAATKEGAFKYCVDEEIPKIDLVVEGSVAVDKSGNRIGKGKGFADMEIDDLFKKSLITDNTRIATTIHSLQLVDFVPTESHDMKLNMVVTTDEILLI